MPTLINELTSQQRSWIFENFGHYGENDELSNGEASSDDLESNYINQDKNHEVSTPVRRNSNESINYCNDPSPTPYINVHHQYSSSITELPPLSACDQQPADSPDNRNTIFRRSIVGSTSTNDATNTSPVREGDGLGRPSPSPIRNLKERPDKPHPGSIWSPLNDKIILATPKAVEHPLYGKHVTSSHADHSQKITSSPDSFNIFPRPPFARSINHPLIPAAFMSPRVATTAMSAIAPSSQRNNAMNEDPSFHFHHPNHAHAPHLHHSPLLYAMGQIPHFRHSHHPLETTAPLGHTRVHLTAENGPHRNHMHTPHPSDSNSINKTIIFPHSDDKLTWEQSFENLKIYKHIYGDCNVPQKYKMNVKLGGWVVRHHIDQSVVQ